MILVIWSINSVHFALGKLLSDPANYLAAWLSFRIILLSIFRPVKGGRQNPQSAEIKAGNAGIDRRSGSNREKGSVLSGFMFQIKDT